VNIVKQKMQNNTKHLWTTDNG